jgi:hypothetical protein
MDEFREAIVFAIHDNRDIGLHPVAGLQNYGAVEHLHGVPPRM